ncbi:TPA: hypothetical protein ACGUUK_002692 [Vibrio vulnificus]
MNEQNRGLQLRVLREQIEIWGVKATWVRADGATETVEGLLSLAEGAVDASYKNPNQFSQIDVAQVAGVFVMETDLVPGDHGDRLMVNGEAFMVLPFKSRTGNQAQTHIPLKPWVNKDHNWR